MIETPAEIPVSCGFCYPDLDPTTYVHQACRAHLPDCGGVDDEIAKNLFGRTHVTGTGTAGGESNQAMCEAIHQRSRVVKGG
jgi:hypothetical protein